MPGGAGRSRTDPSDHRYVTTILEPSSDENSGYLFASEAFLKRLVSLEFKVSEKRRLECFNNLIMLNNASLFFRLENGRSPAKLTDLVEGHFIDAERLVCPHGGAYAIDAARDTCTCSLHNRIKYMTPNVELGLLRVSASEQKEYDRYKRRYSAGWRQSFGPLAVRLRSAPRFRFEAAVLPFANGSLYQTLRELFDREPRALSSERIAESAVLSLAAVPGRDQVLCSVHGNRQEARQGLAAKGDSSFLDLVRTVDEIVLSLRFEKDHARLVLEVARAKGQE